MFVVRVAGNCLDNTTTASLQYGVYHLKVKVLMVLGHEGCGAIKAAQLPESAIAQEPECLGKLLNGLKSGLDEAGLEGCKSSRPRGGYYQCETPGGKASDRHWHHAK